MDISVFATIAALLFTLVGMVATSVWVVAGIKSSISELTVAVREVGKDLDEQIKRSEVLDNRVHNHETRISVIEQGAIQ